MSNIITRGNDFYLKVSLYKNLSNDTTEPFDLSVCDNVEGVIYQELSSKKLCSSVGLVSGETNTILIDVSGLPTNKKYIVEVTGTLNGRSFRAAEKGVFDICEYNSQANITWATIEGESGSELNLTMQFVPSAAVVGKNTYQLAVENGYSGTLQDFIDEMVDSGNSARAAREAAETFSDAIEDATNAIAIANTVSNEVTTISNNLNSNYYKKSEVNERIGNASNQLTHYIDTKIAESGGFDSENYYTKSESDNRFLTEHQDLSSLRTAINNKQDAGDYALRSELPNLNGYATQEWVNSHNYLTQHQDISNLATKTELDNSIELLKVDVEAASGQTLNAQTNKYYRFDLPVSTLVVNLPTITDTSFVNMVILRFTTSSSPAITFNAPAIDYVEGFEIEANTDYEINLLYNGNNWGVMYGTFE